MKDEIISQFAHFWRTYKSICGDFDRDSWKNCGYGLTRPDRLALHILQSTIFYIDGKAPLLCRDGSQIDCHSSEMEKSNLPGFGEIAFILGAVEKKTEDWIRNMDFNKKNEEYPWTGESALSVALFVLRHSQHHLGEMNALLNGQLKGKAEDNFAHSL